MQYVLFQFTVIYVFFILFFVIIVFFKHYIEAVKNLLGNKTEWMLQ